MHEKEERMEGGVIEDKEKEKITKRNGRRGTREKEGRETKNKTTKRKK